MLGLGRVWEVDCPLLLMTDFKTLLSFFAWSLHPHRGRSTSGLTLKASLGRILEHKTLFVILWDIAFFSKCKQYCLPKAQSPSLPEGLIRA